MTKVEILRHPTDEDWERCKMLAMITIGKRWSGEVPEDWKERILRSPHSPKRTLMFTILMDELPYWVSVHFVRHKLGVEHFVSSQRNDRQSSYDRTKAPQDAPVMHAMDINAEELIRMAHMRLCGQASDETREAMQAVCRAVIEVNPEFEPFLVPKCMVVPRTFYCDEFKPCGDARRYLPTNEV